MSRREKGEVEVVDSVATQDGTGAAFVAEAVRCGLAEAGRVTERDSVCKGGVSEVTCTVLLILPTCNTASPAPDGNTILQSGFFSGFAMTVMVLAGSA
jgi:hypothetical protein